MSLFFARQETRSLSWGDVWGDSARPALGGGLRGALRLVPVFAAVSLIADSIATLPLHAFVKTADGGRQLAPTQPRLITDPGLHVHRIAWVHQALSSLLLRGNAYGLVLATDQVATPTRVAWLHPDHVQVDESGPAPVFAYRGKPLDASSVVHVPAFTLPGSVVGLSPVALFRTQFEKAMGAQRFAADVFDRGVAPMGVLRNDERILDPAESATVKKRFKAAVAGRDIFVTGKDWQWEQLSVSSADVAFLEAIEASATEIAAIFRVAPEDIGGKTGHSRTYSNLVMDMQKFTTRTLLPWTARLEESLDALLPATHHARFNLDALTRADLKSRMETHEIALRIGMETLDEGRALEERPPLTDAQKTEWQNLHAKRTPPAPPAPEGTAR